NWSVALSSGSSFSNNVTWLPTTFEDAEVLSADFDGDGADDLLGFYPETGEIQVALSTSNAFSTPTTWLVSFGTDSSQYFVGDFDGNGQDDFIVYHDNGSFEVATSLGDSFQDRGTLGNSFPTDTNQIAIGDLSGDGRIDLVGYTINESNISWQNASWDVLVSNGSYFVFENDWEMETDGVMGYFNRKWDTIKENLRDFGSKLDSLRAKFSKKRRISL
ncbi:VCBS repeat-containing protein, partial [bacterium]|nr:VCBS repeat-containing protein [bacterium]